MLLKVAIKDPIQAYFSLNFNPTAIAFSLSILCTLSPECYLTLTIREQVKTNPLLNWHWKVVNAVF